MGLDIVFWGPWLIGLLIFVIWVWQPIKEFKQMWDEQQARHAASLRGEKRD